MCSSPPKPAACAAAGTGSRLDVCGSGRCGCFDLGARSLSARGDSPLHRGGQGGRRDTTEGVRRTAAAQHQKVGARLEATAPRPQRAGHPRQGQGGRLVIKRLSRHSNSN